MPALRLGSAALVCVAFAPSCIVPPDPDTKVRIGIDVANSYVHRGMVQNEEGVLQPTVDIEIPAKQKGKIILRTFANMDLSNETGDAWFPDGHAGKFSQIDYNVLYEQQLGKNTLITGGLINYNLPNGLEFPFGERGATSEMMLSALYKLPDELLSLRPSFALHYDFDEVNGFYARAGLNHFHEVNDKLSVISALGFGWMDGEQVFWNYGLPDDTSGLADATLKVTGNYALSPGTTLTGFGAYSKIIDSDLNDWFDLIGIDPTQLFCGVGVRWNF